MRIKKKKKKKTWDAVHSLLHGSYSYNMGLDARNPVFRGLWTIQAQTSLRIRAVWSAPFFCFLESIICKLAAGEISIFKLVSLAEETGLKHSLSKHPPPPPPPKTVFSQRGPYDTKQSSVVRKKYPRKKITHQAFLHFSDMEKGIFSYNAINPHMPNVLFVGHR